MTKRPRSRSARVPSPLTEAALHGDAFPSLANFFKAYLHEDFPEEHGTLRAAVAAFVADANPEERQQLVRELETLTRRLSGRSPRTLRRFVTGDLGSRWEPKSREALVELRDLIKESDE